MGQIKPLKNGKGQVMGLVWRWRRARACNSFNLVPHLTLEASVVVGRK